LKIAIQRRTAPTAWACITIILVSALILTSISPALAQELEEDTDRPGMDYAIVELDSPDPTVCARLCAGDARCQAFTYVRPGIQGDRAVCYLKSGAPAPVSDDCCISGLRNLGEEGERDTFAAPGEVEYLVQITTADIPTAGTDADVEIKLIGNDGESDWMGLDNYGYNDFEQGDQGSYVIRTRDIGALKTIRIRHDNSGSNPGWALEKVLVTRLAGDGSPLEIKTFPCYRWLARDEDDREIERELVQAEILTYAVMIATPDVDQCGTDDGIYLALRGETWRTYLYLLDDLSRDDFERGRRGYYLLEAGPLGEGPLTAEITKARCMPMDCKAPYGHDVWCVEEIGVADSEGRLWWWSGYKVGNKAEIVLEQKSSEK